MKKTVKLIFATVLVLCLALSLVGCAPVFLALFGTASFFGEDSTDERVEVNDIYAEVENIDDYREDYLVGNCRELSGEVFVIVFFMDDFESSWSERDINIYTEYEIRPALRFLESEAERYGVPLKMTIKDSYSSLIYDDEVIISIKDTGLCTIDVLWQASEQIGFSSTGEMIEAKRAEYGVDEILCLTVFNKNGTAYAINPKRGYEHQADEHCVLFSRDLYSDGGYANGTHISVVAHETLHLYGAEDFYSFESRKHLAERYYPKDIMLYVAYDIKNNQIGEATAFYVGWSDNMPKILLDEGWLE